MKKMIPVLCLATIGSAMALDVKVSGKVEALYNVYETNVTSTDTAPAIGTQNAGNNNFRETLSFDETELKFKASQKTASGLNTYFETEIEVKGDNTFDLEEASINVDNGKVRLSAGILEDKVYSNIGRVDRYWLNELDYQINTDEEMGLRLGYIANPDMQLDLTLRAYHDAGDSSATPRTNNHTARLQYKMVKGWGDLRLIHEYKTASVEDESQFDNTAASSAKNYEADAHLTWLVYQAYLMDKVFNPFVNVGYKVVTDRAIADTATENETKELNYIVGFDVEVSKKTTVSVASSYRTREKEKAVRTAAGENDKDETLWVSAIGANYKMDPVEFQAGISYGKNNASKVKPGSKDNKFTGLEISMAYEF